MVPTCQPCTLVQVPAYLFSFCVTLVGADLPTYIDRTIAGDGVDILAGSQIVYAAISLTTFDPMIRVVDPANPDYFLRAGWIAFGDSLTLFGAGPLFFWQRPIFLDFAQTLWTPDPASVPGGVATGFGTRIRWHLTGITAGQVHVFGL